ncbi:MAG TPA: hypothetical protein VF595_01665 [Tepidisphaeraceae bacterium]|jgi:c-di-GMP-binding flagellar brake protein YcgR
MTDAAEHLREAIDRNAPAAMAVVSAGITRLTRSRLLALDDDGIWAAMPVGQTDAIDSMIRTRHPVRVNFKNCQSNVEFHTPVLERRRAYQLNADTQTEAIRMAWPRAMSVVQRRDAYRIGVAREDDVTFRFWRIDSGTELQIAPPAGAELSVDVRDFSVSGIGGIWKRQRGEEAVLPSDQRLRVDIITPGTTMTVEAYVRFLAGLPEPEYRRIGIQFMLSPTRLADRTKVGLLNRITGQLQRAELKRLRVAR